MRWSFGPAVANRLRTQRWLLAGVLYGALSGAAAWADDTEIYFGAGAHGSTAAQPNILFVVDTSGSMSNKLPGGESRMDAVKDALKRLLSEVDNVNVGLMRFTNPGGPVMYPLRDINEPAGLNYRLDQGNGNKQYQQFQQKVTGTNDAFQVDGSVGYFIPDRSGGGLTVGTKGDYKGRVEGAQDARQDNSGAFTEGEFGIKHLAWRFNNLPTPRGATIVNARLVHSVLSGGGDGEAEVEVYAYAVDNAPSLSPVTKVDTPVTVAQATKVDQSATLVPVKYGHVQDLLPRTKASVYWEADEPGRQMTSPNLNKVIQEIVDRGGWQAGHSLTLIERPVDHKYDRIRVCSGQQAKCSPVLVIEWVVEHSVRGKSDALTGLRYESVMVPKSAKITEATLTLKRLPPRDASYQVKGEDVGDALPYDNAQDIQSRAAFIKPEKKWQPHSDGKQVDVSQIVSKIVKRSDWKPGNAMSFIITGGELLLTSEPVEDPEDPANIDQDLQNSGVTVPPLTAAAPHLDIVFEMDNNDCSSGTCPEVRQVLIDTVDDFIAKGYTPIVDTLYEAANYYLGGEVLHGAQRNPSKHGILDPSPYAGISFKGQASHLQKRTRVSHPLSYTNGLAERDTDCTSADLNDDACRDERIVPEDPGDVPTYISPITHQCQSNHIVLLSDGLPNEAHFDDLLQAMTGNNCTGNNCGPALTEALFDTSLGNAALRDYSIVTHTIGFASNSAIDNYLKQLSEPAGGQFHTADNADNLLEVFKAIMRQAKDTDTTFVAPGVAVDQANKLRHLDSMFFGLFKPDDRQRWVGNLKRYRLHNGQLVDVGNVPAVNDATGYFSDTAQSYWSNEVDGKKVAAGGAAKQLTQQVLAQDRKVLSNSSGGTSLDEIALSEIYGDEYSSQHPMGDPLHASPVLLDYGAQQALRYVVFVPTNEGMLHAFSISNFNDVNPQNESVHEEFAFIPKALLPNVPDLMDNLSTTERKYGLDGDITVWQDDATNSTTLYFGMRRGGRNYYALDVSSPSTPLLKFGVIQGGEGDFARLGQTWSQPVLTKVKIGDTVKQVLLFGGGYDPNQDIENTARSADSMGNAVYMVDAATGDRLWWASDDAGDTQVSAMTNGIPARLSVIDQNNDGLADLFYAVDTGGRIFRFDIYQGETGSDLVNGALLADLGDRNGLAPDNRRFYHAADVSLVADGGQPYYAVAVGSGYRAHPLNNTAADRFYLVKDRWAFLDTNKDDKYDFPSQNINDDELITEAKLYNAAGYVGDYSGLTAPELQALKQYGWYLPLGSGEKVLSSPLTLNNQILFTTYVPAAYNSVDPCAAQEGSGKLFLLDLFTGNAVDDVDSSFGDLQKDDVNDQHDRWINLAHGGIPPQPRLIFVDPSDPTLCVGAECFDASASGNCAGVNCLTENLLGDLPRVRRITWEPLIEAVPPSEMTK